MRCVKVEPRLVAITLGVAVMTAADRLAAQYPKSLEDFPLRTDGDLNNIHLHRDIAATTALSRAMRELGISELWETLNSDSDSTELLVMAVVLRSGKALGTVSRQWRSLGGSVALDNPVFAPVNSQGVAHPIASEAAALEIPAWYGFLGRACTRLGLLEHLSIAGYRRVFELR
jgi:hypothetical protein